MIEHLVRMGEIRIALARNDKTEAQRLRRMHIHELKMILIPVLEKKIAAYETQRTKYPHFKTFLPELLRIFHSMKPEDVDALVGENLK